MNYEEFYGAVCEMVEKFEASEAANKELDAYLLALLRLLEARGGDTFRSAKEPKTAADIMRCLPEGFEIKFDESRSANFKTALSEAKFTNGDRKNDESRTLEQNSIAASGSVSAKTARGESFGQKTNSP